MNRSCFLSKAISGFYSHLFSPVSNRMNDAYCSGGPRLREAKESRTPSLPSGQLRADNETKRVYRCDLEWPSRQNVASGGGRQCQLTLLFWARPAWIHGSWVNTNNLDSLGPVCTYNVSALVQFADSFKMAMPLLNRHIFLGINNNSMQCFVCLVGQSKPSISHLLNWLLERGSEWGKEVWIVGK